MADLIDRLRERAEFEDKRVLDEAKAMGFVPEVYSGSQTGALLREAAAALEAAREDSERLDWLDTQRGDDVRQDPHSGDPVLVAHYWAIEGQCTDIRSAIDQARGKGVADA